MTANEIITAALRKLLVVEAGDTPSASLLSSGLEALNDYMGSLSSTSQIVYEVSRETLTIPVSTQSITIGATGTLVTGRPTKINHASLMIDNIEYPLELIDDAGYQRVWNKSEINMPGGLYYHKTWPNGTLYFDATTDQEYSLVLSSEKQLTAFPDGTTDIDMPDAYARFLKSNLAIELADEVGAGNRVTPSMAAIADDSKKNIVGQSLKVNVSSTNLHSGTPYNIETG